MNWKDDKKTDLFRKGERGCSSLLSSQKSLGRVPRTRAKGRRMGCAGSNAAQAVAPGQAVPTHRATPNEDGEVDKEEAESGSQYHRQRGAIASAIERAAQKIHRWKQGSPAEPVPVST